MREAIGGEMRSGLKWKAGEQARKRGEIKLNECGYPHSEVGRYRNVNPDESTRDR